MYIESCGPNVRPVCSFLPPWARNPRTDIITSFSSPPPPQTPRGKWHCPGCNLKAPKKKFKRPSLTWRIKEDDELVRAGVQEDLPPPPPPPAPISAPESPEAPSHSSPAAAEAALPVENEDTNAAAVGTSETINNAPSTNNAKAAKKRPQKSEKDLAVCHTLLSELGGHDESWPFLAPVNTKQFPTYKKIIKTPMDISTIRKKLNDGMCVF